MAKAAIEVRSFVPAADDPLAAEHAMVQEWVAEVRRSIPSKGWWRAADLKSLLKSLPSGQRILECKAEEGRRLVLAALEQVRHWDKQAEQIRLQGTTEHQRLNAHLLPGWDKAWGPRRQTATILFALLRRSLPFEADDLIVLMAWCEKNQLSTYHYPLGAIVKAVQRHVASVNELPLQMREAMQRFATILRSSHDKSICKLGTTIEQLDPDERKDSCAEDVPASKRKSHPRPAPAGDPRVLSQLKRHLGIVEPSTGQAETTTLDPDRFPMRLDTPFEAEHRFLSNLFFEVIGTIHYSDPQLTKLKTGILREIYDAGRGRLLLASVERAAWGQLAATDYSNHHVWQSRHAAIAIVPKLAQLNFVMDRHWTFDHLLYVATRVPPHARPPFDPSIKQCLAFIEKNIEQTPLTEGERYVLHLLRISLITGPLFNKPGPEVIRLNRLIEDGAIFFLVPGEAWSDGLNDDLRDMPLRRRQVWTGLLHHLLTATGARPGVKWLQSAEQLVKSIGQKLVLQSLSRWLPLVSKGQTIGRPPAYAGDARGQADTIHPENAAVLRGMMWLMPLLKRPDHLARLASAVALSAYKKVSGVGPRAVKVGNAAIYALSAMSSAAAVGQLAMLKTRVKFGTAQKEIEKAFSAAAESLGLPRDEIEEMGVPSYGLEEVGVRRESFAEGQFTAELRIEGRQAAIHWFGQDGKERKSVPAAVKSAHNQDVKELQAASKDIAAMLSAQVERLDGLFLGGKQWTFETWRQRYLDHPLVGTLARRLIWIFDGRAGIWRDGRIVDIDDRPIELSEDAAVVLWHPIGRPMEEVLAWRNWLMQHEVSQPFKQAHREVYLLTDAERQTGTYSNRFAGHVLRQHQFHALCGARGWKNKLRLMVDDVFPPASKELPLFGLRAEFWIEGVGDDFGTDTTEAGSYFHVATDQVRFFRGAEAVAMEEVPALAFTEVMRDVDLFVGVASVGNDPQWRDRGEAGFGQYWHDYSFGDLSETARTRREVLVGLIPRLKIGGQCEVREKFLIVRGRMRTYKIHLGSGNILMEPNDQYLCIVPARGGGGSEGNLFLPFEGDGTLSVILSKAFMLAEDEGIQDPGIVRQIQQGRTPNAS